MDKRDIDRIVDALQMIGTAIFFVFIAVTMNTCMNNSASSVPHTQDVRIENWPVR